MNRFDEYDVTFASGITSRMTRSCLYECYLNNPSSAKDGIVSYVQVVSAI